MKQYLIGFGISFAIGFTGMAGIFAFAKASSWMVKAHSETMPVIEVKIAPLPKSSLMY